MTVMIEHIEVNKSGIPSKLQLKYTNEYGRVLVATSEIAAGDVILEETPLLHVPQLTRDHPLYRQLNNYDNLHQINPIVVLKLYAYFQSADVVKSKVQQLYSPDLSAFAHNPVIVQARAYLKTLKEHPPFPEFKDYLEATEEDTVLKVWLAWVVNGHRYYGGSALFEVGSKLTHSCERPNTKYRTWGTDGVQSYHLAASAIAAGSILTTNYIGWDFKALQSTPHRQAFLEDKFLFKCRCPKCTSQPDKLRAIPCPVCSESHRATDKLLTTEAAYCNTDMGFLLWDPQAAAVGLPQPWKCERCEASFADNPEELWGRYYKKSFAHIEADLESFALRLDASLDDEPRMGSIRDFSRKIHDIGRLLGGRHWVSLRLFFVAIRVHCAELERIIDDVEAGETSGSQRADASFCAGELMKHCQLLWRLLSDYTDEDPGEVVGPFLNQAAQVLLQLAAARLLRLSECLKLTQQVAQLLRQALPGLVRITEEVEDIAGSTGGPEGTGGVARVAEQLLLLLEGLSVQELEEGEEEEEEGNVEEPVAGQDPKRAATAGAVVGNGEEQHDAAQQSVSTDSSSGCVSSGTAAVSRHDGRVSSGTAAVSRHDGRSAVDAECCAAPTTPADSSSAAASRMDACVGSAPVGAGTAANGHEVSAGADDVIGSVPAAAASRPPGWAAKAQAIQAALREAEADRTA